MVIRYAREREEPVDLRLVAVRLMHTTASRAMAVATIIRR